MISIDFIRNNGVVGAGGAGFPTDVKLNTTVDYVIANGAECEPLLHIDKYLMREYPDRIIHGLKLAMELTKAQKGIVAVKEKYEKEIEALEKVIKTESRITLFKLKDFYPAGDEHFIVYKTTGRIVPESGIPLMVGCVVDNVGTLVNISLAYEGQPVTHRYLTIAGAVNNPCNVLLPIGTSIQEALKIAGGVKTKDFVVIIGGPLMGTIAHSLEVPITKTTTGLIVLPKSNPLVALKSRNIKKMIDLAKTVCIQCNTCTELCSRYSLGHRIKPHILMRAVGFNYLENLELLGLAYLCSECGICGYYSCPFGITPNRIIANLKILLAKKGVPNTFKNRIETPRILSNERGLPIERILFRMGLKEFDTIPEDRKETFKIKQVKILLKQHIGAASIPVVKEHQEVKVNQLIADIPSKGIGAKIHASISGIVERITDEAIYLNYA